MQRFSLQRPALALGNPLRRFASGQNVKGIWDETEFLQ